MKRVLLLAAAALCATVLYGQADKSTIENLAMANANVQKFVAGQAVKKVVVVPGRLVNLVL